MASRPLFVLPPRCAPLLCVTCHVHVTRDVRCECRVSCTDANDKIGRCARTTHKSIGPILFRYDCETVACHETALVGLYTRKRKNYVSERTHTLFVDVAHSPHTATHHLEVVRRLLTRAAGSRLHCLAHAGRTISAREDGAAEVAHRLASPRIMKCAQEEPLRRVCWPLRGRVSQDSGGAAGHRPRIHQRRSRSARHVSRNKTLSTRPLRPTISFLALDANPSCHSSLALGYQLEHILDAATSGRRHPQGRRAPRQSA